MSQGPAYLRVLATFARNSLVRDMTFRWNFLIESVSSLVWACMNLGLYVLIYRYTNSIGLEGGWGQYQFYVFLATTYLINSLVQTFFMPNVDEFSELIRTGGLDFALLKPIDTQFLISLQKIDWSALSNSVFAVGLLSYSLWKIGEPLSILQPLLYVVYVLCGVAILYSLMTSVAASSVFLGRNQNLYDIWFYLTTFSRYPMEIYRGTWGTPLRGLFTFIIPVLIVVNVPARILTRPLEFESLEDAWLPLFALFITAASLIISRWIFQRALLSYRSASS